MVDEQLDMFIAGRSLPICRTAASLRYSEILDGANRSALQVWERHESTEFAFAPKGAIRPRLEFMSFESARELVGSAS